MSTPNAFPVYTVRGYDGRPCGHQHQHESQAENCAMNNAQSFRGKRFTVLKWGTRSEDITPEVINHFEVKLV